MNTTGSFVAALQPDKSARRAVEACLARIASDNSQLKAVSLLFAERALARAAELDQLLADGGPFGPLHGMPILVKELIDIEGVPTSFGSLDYSHSPAPRTAPVLARLESAGAILIGTTHMVEFAIGSWGTNYAKGTPWNPADRLVHRVAGGSSSGSAVAVAAGLTPAAIGSDTGGSIRIPASLCGVVGFKPTYGLIPTDGVAPLGPTFDTLGPLTTNIDDARLLTEAMAGIDLTHPFVPVDGLRIGVVGDDFLEPMADDVAAAYKTAMVQLQSAGVRFEEITLPLSFVDFQKLNGDIVAFEAFQHLERLVEDPRTQLDPHVRKRVLAGRMINPARYRELLDELSFVRKSFDAVFSGLDALALPGTPISAPPLSEVDESKIPMSRYTRLANCLDLCAICLPLNLPNGKMPIGLQLCCRAHSDARLLAIASSISALVCQQIGR